MEINTYLFGFSLIIISLGIISFFAISKEMKDASVKKFELDEKEGGPRAKLFDAMFTLLADEDKWPEEVSTAKKAEMRKIVKEMNEKKK